MRCWLTSVGPRLEEAVPPESASYMFIVKIVRPGRGGPLGGLKLLQWNG